MGIDTDGVGGIGIELTEEVIQKFISNGYFTEEEWENEYYECLETIGRKFDVSFYTAGNHYTGYFRHYLLVNGQNLKEIIDDSQNFIETFKKIGLELTLEDLLVISDYSIS